MPFHEVIVEGTLLPWATSAGTVGILFVIYMLSMFAMSALSMVSYVLYSLGLYTIAERRGIRHPWLAWVPVGNLWILGSISDQYQYVVRGNVKNRRKLLLALSIGLVVLYIGLVVAVVAGMIASESVGSVGVAVVLAILGLLAILVMAFVLVIFQYVCLNDLYNSCNPNNGVLFLVLSILFSITMSFFVFACRKKDMGMPPKKRPVPQPVAEIVEAEEQTTEVEMEEEPVEEGFARPEEFEEE